MICKLNAVVFTVSNCQLQENLSFYSIIAGSQLFKGTKFRTRLQRDELRLKRDVLL